MNILLDIVVISLIVFLGIGFFVYYIAAIANTIETYQAQMAREGIASKILYIALTGSGHVALGAVFLWILGWLTTCL